MKIRYAAPAALLFCILVTGAAAQTPAGTGGTAGSTTGTTGTTGATGTTGTADAGTAAAGGSASASLPAGYADVNWGDEYTAVKDKVKGKVVFADENRMIVSRDSEITYRYGFFYIDPERVSDMPNAGAPARLFFTTIAFPYLPSDDIRKKIAEKYGEPTGDNISKNRGAMFWEGEKTIVVMWVDEYEKKPFCRKVDYFSKDIVKELKDYKTRIFNKTEIEVLKNFLP